MPNPISVYLIPGQGADYRLFNELRFPAGYDIHKLSYLTPKKGMRMKDFALELSKQIDTEKPFILIGTSLGGMLATEMAHFLHPEITIIISSAKNRKELPFSYRFQKQIPVYRIFPPFLIKLGAQIMQPIVEPDRNKHKEIFKAMLKDKDPKFLSRTIGIIINWDRQRIDKNIIHVHGNKDSTLPLKNVQYDHLIENGSHMMTLTRGKEISALIAEIFMKHSFRQ